jgi:hypothetical protein
MLAKGVAGVASVGDDPSGYTGQAVEQENGVRELVGLPRRDPEGYGPTRSVRDDYRLGAIATARAAKRFARTASRPVAPLAAAPAAFWWARTLVPSRNVMPSWTPRSWARTSRRAPTRRDATSG